MQYINVLECISFMYIMNEFHYIHEHTNHVLTWLTDRSTPRPGAIALTTSTRTTSIQIVSIVTRVNDRVVMRMVH